MFRLHFLHCDIKKMLYICRNFSKAFFYIFMINRNLIRTKVVLILFSYYKNNDKTILSLEKELLFSFQKAYDLYYYLLQLAVEITRFSRQKIENGLAKLRPTYEEQNPNRRFADNRFIAQLEQNEQLNKYLETNKLSWADHLEIVKEIAGIIAASDFYKAYMEAETCTYEDDKAIWRKIFSKIIMYNDLLDEHLEEQSIYWVNDIELVLSFIDKTIKKFEQEQGSEQPLMPMFKSEDDLDYAKKLLRTAIQNETEYQKMISEHTENWEYERMAYMDRIIMQTAIAELMAFPTIPVNVTLNEYVEIAKQFSSDNSFKFINGVLDDLVDMLKKEKKLMKAVILPDMKP